MNFEKRQMSNQMAYRDLLNAYTVTDLKNILKTWEITGYSKYKKNELVECIDETIKSALISKLPEFNLDHYTIVFQLYQGKNVFNEFPNAARQLIEMGLILEGMIDDQKQVLLSNEVYKAFSDFYNVNQDLIAFNTILKDYLEFSVEIYGVLKVEEIINDFYDFNEGSIEKDVIQNLLPAVIKNASNCSSDSKFIYYYRLAEYEKVYHDLNQKSEVEKKKILPEMLQTFVQNRNSLYHERFDSVKSLMEKHLKGDEHLFDQTIDEMRVMISYNHSMSDFLHLFSKKHEITEMQILKDLADDLIVINNELPHWELKGNAPIELALSKNQPLVKGDKVGRNDLCPCGSGKKYKKCCLISG